MSNVAPMSSIEGTAARRRYPRYQLSIPFDVTVFRPGAALRLSGRAQDLGEGGLRGVVSGTALPGERVELLMLLPNASEPLSMHAIVRHQGDLHCGFEFLSLDQEQREQLQRLAEDPALRAGIINEAEWQPGMAPVPRSGTVLCESCGYEYPEDAAMCVMCGTPQSKMEPVEEIVSDRTGPRKLFRPSMWATAMSASAAYYGKSRRMKGSLLDSLVAVVFLVTLSVGLWQWLQSPVDSSSQSTPITVDLEDVILRPAADAIATATPESSPLVAPTSNGSGSVGASFVKTIGDKVFPTRPEPVGQPGSGSAEPRRKSEQRSSESSLTSSLFRRQEPLERPNSSSRSVLRNIPALKAQPNHEAAAAQPGTPSPADLESMLLQKVLPVYPARARRDGVEGQVILQAVIGRDGTIASLHPLQGPPELAAAAIDAVQHWRFRPYQLNGKPVEVETNIRLNFQLPKN
ncbi:MAG TPA: TonB family protein [Terriglobales bacterium]|nr:TonB family protein [Terriglobales bacterium]